MIRINHSYKSMIEDYLLIPIVFIDHFEVDNSLMTFRKVRLYRVFLNVPWSDFLLGIECLHLNLLSSERISRERLSSNFSFFCPSGPSKSMITSEFRLRLTIMAPKSLELSM